MMKRILSFAFACILTMSATAAPRQRAVRAPGFPSGAAYLEAAKSAARWLDSMERRTARGLAWPWSDRNPYTAPGLGSGAAGIGTFFLRLHQVTGDAVYLEKARGAAAFVASEFKRTSVLGPDWQSGTVGGGEFLLLMYRHTGETIYRDDARALADLLLAGGTREGDSIHWPLAGSDSHFTGIVHGTAGVAMFFARVAEVTGAKAYLTAAEDAYRWVRRHTVPLAEGIGWKRRTKDTEAYHGFCGGSAGILVLSLELHRATGEARYLEDYVATADGLAASRRTPAPGQASWPYTSSNSGNAPVVYCHGTSCAITALAEAWKVTGNGRYQSIARDGAERLRALSLTIDGAAPAWPHVENFGQVETGYQTGAASVGYTFLRLHALLGDHQSLARAVEVGDFLLKVADRPAAGQMRWINFLLMPPDKTREYETGWYAGAAGIGLFLLDLHDRLSGKPPIERFSPMRP